MYGSGCESYQGGDSLSCTPQSTQRGLEVTHVEIRGYISSKYLGTRTQGFRVLRVTSSCFLKLRKGVLSLENVADAPVLNTPGNKGIRG